MMPLRHPSTSSTTSTPPYRSRLAAANAAHKHAVQAVRDYVDLMHGEALLAHQGSRLRGSAGIPDLLCLFPDWGLGFYVEVKTGGGVLSPAQEHVTRTLRICGYEVIVGGLEEVSARVGAVIRDRADKRRAEILAQRAEHSHVRKFAHEP